MESDNRALYPDEAGHFNLLEANLPFGAVLGVEGPNLPLGSSSSRMTVSSTAQSSGVGASASYNSQPPLFKSVIPKHSSSKEQRITVKII